MAIGGGQNMGGLLGDGLDDPKTQQVLGLAQGLLAGGAPQVGKPVSFGGALATGIGQMQKSYGDAINNQYKKAIMEKTLSDAKKPKRTPIAGGAFTLVTYPDGRSEVIKNEGVQEALIEQRKAQAEIDLSQKAAEKKLTNPNNLNKAEQEFDKKQVQNLQEKREAYRDWPNTKRQLEQMKGNIDGGGIKGLLGETSFSAAFGLNEDEQQARIFLEGLAQKLAKARNGARVTDADVTNAKKSIPSLYLEGENFDRAVDELIKEFEAIEAQVNSETEYFDKNGTFKGYDYAPAEPMTINGVTVEKVG